MTESLAPEESRRIRMVEVTPGGLAFRQEDVVEFVADPLVAPLETGTIWRGMTNLRGELIAVADAGEISGGETSSQRTMVAVTDGETTVGILCDEISQVDSGDTFGATATEGGSSSGDRGTSSPTARAQDIAELLAMQGPGSE